MEWYYVALIVVGYYIMWIVSSIIIRRTTYFNETAVMFGLFWPITLPVVLAIVLIEEFGEK